MGTRSNEFDKSQLDDSDNNDKETGGEKETEEVEETTDDNSINDAVAVPETEKETGLAEAEDVGNERELELEETRELELEETDNESELELEETDNDSDDSDWSASKPRTRRNKARRNKARRSNRIRVQLLETRRQQNEQPLVFSKTEQTKILREQAKERLEKLEQAEKSKWQAKAEEQLRKWSAVPENEPMLLVSMLALIPLNRTPYQRWIAPLIVISEVCGFDIFDLVWGQKAGRKDDHNDLRSMTPIETLVDRRWELPTVPNMQRHQRTFVWNCYRKVYVKDYHHASKRCNEIFRQRNMAVTLPGCPTFDAFLRLHFNKGRTVLHKLLYSSRTSHRNDDRPLVAEFISTQLAECTTITEFEKRVAAKVKCGLRAKMEWWGQQTIEKSWKKGNNTNDSKSKSDKSESNNKPEYDKSKSDTSATSKEMNAKETKEMNAKETNATTTKASDMANGTATANKEATTEASKATTDTEASKAMTDLEATNSKATPEATPKATKATPEATNTDATPKATNMEATPTEAKATTDMEAPKATNMEAPKATADMEATDSKATPKADTTDKAATATNATGNTLSNSRSKAIPIAMAEAEAIPIAMAIALPTDSAMNVENIEDVATFHMARVTNVENIEDVSVRREMFRREIDKRKRELSTKTTTKTKTTTIRQTTVTETYKPETFKPGTPYPVDPKKLAELCCQMDYKTLLSAIEKEDATLEEMMAKVKKDLAAQGLASLATNGKQSKNDKPSPQPQSRNGKQSKKSSNAKPNNKRKLPLNTIPTGSGSIKKAKKGPVKGTVEGPVKGPVKQQWMRRPPMMASKKPSVPAAITSGRLDMKAYEAAIAARDPGILPILSKWKTMCGTNGSRPLYYATLKALAVRESLTEIFLVHNTEQFPASLAKSLLQAPQRSVGHTYEKPGCDFVTMAREVMSYMESFLRACDLWGVSIMRYYWEFYLMQGMQKHTASSMDPQLRLRAMLFCLVISAASTDSSAIESTINLHRVFGLNIDLMADAEDSDILTCIIKAGIGPKRAKYIKAICTRLRDDFGGRIPCSLEVLVTFPGVGRKTAVLLLLEGFGMCGAGIGTDKHVCHVSYAIGLYELPTDLKALYPVHVENSLREWVAIQHYKSVNCIFGCMAQLLTQDISTVTKGDAAVDAKVNFVLAALCSQFQVEYSVEIIWFIIGAIRRHYIVSNCAVEYVEEAEGFNPDAVDTGGSTGTDLEALDTASTVPVLMENVPACKSPFDPAAVSKSPFDNDGVSKSPFDDPKSPFDNDDA
ncbi:Endonuclease III-like protein 1 [Seminavis robusta]|uniref:Endonuclease III-like protein 1 n=1 Tax=Seminavis robusta TaxID=568900 RepID=A0A9N8EBT4_9STRA|nr:Endonuclease III-like protein 1 [Seminavis robusta]|eukprot:Sro775_g200760.1 Endonuclease III-like protein 1 (1269) ;mRNA; f:6602-10408